MHLAAKAREKERRGLPINDWSMGQCIPVGTALIHNVIWFFIKQTCLADEVHSKVLSKFLDPSLALPRPGIPLIASPFKRRACRVKEAAVEALTKNGIRPGPPRRRRRRQRRTDWAGWIESGDCLSGAREVPLARSPDGRRARAAARWRRCHCSAHSPERTRWSAARPSCCFLQLGPLLYRPRRPTHIYSLLRPPILFCIPLPRHCRQKRPERECDLTHLNHDGVRVVCASLLEREKC